MFDGLRTIRGAPMIGLLVAAFSVFLSGGPVQGQFGMGDWREPPKPPKRDIIPGNRFTFCTVEYRRVRYEDLGLGWNTDWPLAGLNFMTRLAELTTIEIDREADGQPNQVSLKLTDKALFNYPYVFLSDAGTVGLSTEEAEALRSYLLRGGFLHVDDFWGSKAWEYWVDTISEVLPPDEYPIFDIPLDHDIFHIVFDVKEVPQVPSIQYWRATRDGTTSERGSDSAEPHLRGIRDKKGRLIVLMSHNTDLADGWEREGADEAFFNEFSVKKSYPLGINIVVYAMTH